VPCSSSDSRRCGGPGSTSIEETVLRKVSMLSVEKAAASVVIEAVDTQ